MPARKVKIQTARLPTVRLAVERRGKGRKLLVLHGEDGFEATTPAIDALAARRQLILPWAPGYGTSPLPDFVSSVDDIAYIYLDLLDQMEIRSVDVIGVSLGAWLAAEMATKCPERFRRLVLVSPVGAKFGGAYDRDIEDIYFHPRERVQAMRFHDAANDPLGDMSGLSDDEAMRVAQHRETTARLCWKPYFHNPGLAARLHRITCPTLVITGARDGFTPPAYGRAFAKAIPKAKLSAIKRAGHYPHIERPDAFLEDVTGFLG